jgi:hypothetical protein
MYSIADGPLTATLPASWNPGEITARSLFIDRKEEARFQMSGRKITVQMQARRPVMIYRSQSFI